MGDPRDSIRSDLTSIISSPLRHGAIRLLSGLGYRSDRTLDLGDSSPRDFLEFIRSNDAEGLFNREKALVSEWVSADLLFQLTDEELGGHSSLFKETNINSGILRSYVFFAIDLNGGNYARGKLTAIVRQINRVFPMPVMVLIRHKTNNRPTLSIAVINRRQQKRDQAKDVLGKVSIIRDIALEEPHRGHLDILNSIAFDNLEHPQRLTVNSFERLHAAWEEIFNVELLNKKFYRELSSWYLWALRYVNFPDDVEKDKERRDATSLIRLLTRVIFCWFLKEKGLIPERLFNETELAKILVDLKPESCTFHQGILQNLFFATLNQRMGEDEGGRPFRAFAKDEGFVGNRNNHGVSGLYRYEEHFRYAGTALTHFEDIPFLNGGLFECLDRDEGATTRRLYIDGFSRNPNKRPVVPNHLFFRDAKTEDLSEEFGDKRRRNEPVRGLVRILHSYKFTIVENTPIDQEIALDPELLGKVFENLLASYNEETKSTARKETGSFYTQRPIVEYMVDQSLKAYLADALARSGMREGDANVGLDLLFMYTERDHPFNEAEVDVLLDAIHTCKILDPACGSGAFPMGMLQKLVYIIHKLDPDNIKWKQLQIEKAGEIPDVSSRHAAIDAIERDFADNEDDYGRKLYLIESCLYGVDIQPIAIQISKLRFFISLVCDQRTNRDKQDNHGIRPLPNLETKFVAADTLIGLPAADPLVLRDRRVDKIELELEALYHKHFTIQRREAKLVLQDEVKRQRKKLAELLGDSVMSSTRLQQVADWDPFDQQASSRFFDPHWMFGRSLAEGFDIVLGNPPYRQIQKFSTAQKAIWKDQAFETYSATADIYCLFYERGAELLRDGGQLCYITSNKWMRAGYGEPLRSFLSTRVDTRSVLDFGMAQNFGEATTYTCVVHFTKRRSTNRTRSCYATEDVAAVTDPAGYFEANHVVQRGLNDDPWVVISRDKEGIKALVEEQGVPLGEWDLAIYRGILTGLNDAFYLTQSQRDRFVQKNSKYEGILAPLLRGRHIERYATSWDGTWLINAHNGVKEAGMPRLDVQRDYPLAWQHLLQFERRLRKRYDKGDHWSNLRNCAYLHEFERPKIMYPNMTKYLPFYYDERDGYFTNDKGFIVTSASESLPYLTAVLNSSLFRCCFRDNFPELLGNTYEVRKIFIDKIPIRRPQGAEQSIFACLVPLVQLAKSQEFDAAAQFLEDLIDACVMECYFKEHMADRGLLILDDLRPHLHGYDDGASDSARRAFLEALFRKLNASESQIRNRLVRLPADSPELLAVIKEEGRV